MIQTAVVDGSQLSHYADGVLVDTQTHTYNTATDRIVLGAEIDGTPQLDMAVAAVVVYDRALTPAEVTQVETHLTAKYLSTGPDVTDPVVAGGLAFTVSDGAVNGATVGLVTASDDVAVVNLAISSGDPTGVFAIDPAGTLTVADGSQLVDGATYSLIVEAQDAAGNTGSALVVVDVEALPDTTAPTVAAGQAFTVTVAASAGDTVGTIVHSDDVGVVSMAITAGDTNGDFALSANGVLTLVNALPVGAYTLTVAASDAAGNTGSGAVDVAVFDPSGLVPGAVLLLEGDAGVSVAGSTISGWADQSGNGNDLDVISGNPTLGAAPSGVPVVSTDGILDSLRRTTALTGMPMGGSDRTVFLLADYRDAGYGGFAYGRSAKNRAFGLIVNPDGNLVVSGWGFANDYESSAQGVGQGWLIQSAVVESGSMSHYLDGTLIDSQSHTYRTTGSLITVGAELSGSPQRDMSIGAVLVYDRALTAAERLQVETYLTNKYLVTGPDVVAPAIPVGQQIDAPSQAATGDIIGTLVATDNVGVVSYSVTGGDANGIFSVSNTGVVSIANSTLLVDGSQHVLTVEVSDAASNTASGSLTIDVFDGSGLVAGAVLLLEADAGISTSGTAVSNWADQSGNGNNLSGGGDPTVGTSPSGAPAIVFDGTLDQLRRDGFLVDMPSGADDRTVFVVADYRSAGWGGFSWGRNKLNDTFGVTVSADGDLAVQAWGTFNDIPSSTPGTGAGWLLQTVRLESNQMSHFADGVLIDSATHTYGTSLDSIVIGAEIDEKPFLDMSVAAVVVYDRALSTSEQLQVEAYLQAKYLQP